jgi:hypothetical protein
MPRIVEDATGKDYSLISDPITGTANRVEGSRGCPDAMRAMPNAVVERSIVANEVLGRDGPASKVRVREIEARIEHRNLYIRAVES